MAFKCNCCSQVEAHFSCSHHVSHFGKQDRGHAHAEGMHLFLPRVIVHRPHIIWYLGGFPCEGALGWGCAVQMEAANIAMSALPPSLEVSVFDDEYRAGNGI